MVSFSDLLETAFTAIGIGIPKSFARFCKDPLQALSSVGYSAVTDAAGEFTYKQPS